MEATMKAVVMLSGGVGSWNAGRRAVNRYGPDEVVLLFADTLVEDEDTYRFLRESAAQLGAPLIEVADGRSPFEVFHDDRFLGNARLANCSKYLKQKPCRDWLTDNAGEDVTVVVGIDWQEEHRLPAIVNGWKPWTVWAPLCDKPLLDKPGMLANVKAAGLTPPSAYADGLPHANCLGQGCVRGGQAYWEKMLRTRPEAYAYSEREEEALRQHLGKDVAMLKDRTGGEARPLTLREFRERLERQPNLFDGFEWGGCGCFTEDAA
jgi:hypothetical protein